MWLFKKKKDNLKDIISYFDSKDSRYWFYLYGIVKYSHIEELENLGCIIIRYKFSNSERRIRFKTKQGHIIDFHPRLSRLEYEEHFNSSGY